MANSQHEVEKLEADLEKKDFEKYGDKSDDIIARTYRDSVHNGDVWCAKNVERYLHRFIGESHKSNNIVDLIKAKNYIERMIQQHSESAKTAKEVIE